MKKVTLYILTMLISVVLFQCNTKPEEKVLPRIAIAGLSIESSTFSPALTNEEAFHAKTGDTILPLILSYLPTRLTARERSGSRL